MTLPAMPLSVLDLAPVSSGSTPQEALASTIALAQHVEALGFTRFWVAEHHNMPGIASSAPSVLIAALGAATSRIRIGSGGVMLPNHPPLVVAEQFGMLENLYPGRIDLGIGRAPGTDQTTARALRRSVDQLSVDDFPDQLNDLMCFLQGEFPEGHPMAKIAAAPHSASMPQIWLLGSSGYSAQVAGILGLPFGFAHHFSARNTLPALDLYRRSFRPSAVLDKPYAAIGVRMVIAESDERAEFLSGSSMLSFLRMATGRLGQLPSPEEAAAHPWTRQELEFVADRLDGQVIGSPETAERKLADLLELTQVDELMITTALHDPRERTTTLTRVSEMFGKS